MSYYSKKRKRKNERMYRHFIDANKVKLDAVANGTVYDDVGIKEAKQAEEFEEKQEFYYASLEDEFAVNKKI